MVISYTFFETVENQERGWLWNGKPIEIIGEVRIEINDIGFDFNPDIQKSLLDTTKKSVKDSKGTDKVHFRIC